MIIYEEEFNFIGLAEYREGRGYFILAAIQDVKKCTDNFTVSLRIERGTATLFWQIGL